MFDLSPSEIKLVVLIGILAGIATYFIFKAIKVGYDENDKDTFKLDLDEED